jgi:hypothetical protein
MPVLVEYYSQKYKNNFYTDFNFWEVHFLMCFIKFQCDAIAQSSGKIFCPLTKITNHTGVVTPIVSVTTHHSVKSQRISSISKKRLAKFRQFR